MTQQTTSGYPGTASILALAGGILMIVGGILLVSVSAFILPNISYANMQVPPGVTNMAGLVSGAVGVAGVFGLTAGVVVLASSV